MANILTKKSPVEKAFNTRAKNLQAKAKTLKQSVKGIYTPEARKIRKQAKELTQQAKSFRAKAKERQLERKRELEARKPAELALDRAKALATRAKNEEAKAKEYTERAKGLKTDEAKKLRAEADRLRKLAHENVKKSSDRIIAWRKQEWELRKQAKKPSKSGLSTIEIEDADNRIAIDTATEQMNDKFVGSSNTKLGEFVLEWLADKEQQWGTSKLNGILTIALNRNPDLFDALWKIKYEYRITEADTTLVELERAAEDYFKLYQQEYKAKQFDEESLGSETIARTDEII